MKKLIAIITLLALSSFMLAGCGKTTAEETTKIITQEEAEKIAKKDLSEYLDGANLVTYEMEIDDNTDEGDHYHVKIEIKGMKEGIVLPRKNVHVCDVDKHTGEISNRDEKWDKKEPY